MLMLTMREWVGPSRHPDPRMSSPLEPRERLCAFVTRLPLAQALERIGAYSDAFRIVFDGVQAVEYSLVMVQTIDDLDAKHVELAQMEYVEELHQTAGEFGADV